MDGTAVSFQRLQRPSTTGSYTSTSSRLKQKREMQEYQERISAPHKEDGYETLVEERSIDLLPSESSRFLDDDGSEDLSFINSSQVRQVEHVVDAWIEHFIEDVAPHFPSVSRKREFGMRILNVFLERNLRREASSRPNRLVTTQDKCTGTVTTFLGEENGAGGGRDPEAPETGSKSSTSSDFGTQTILLRDLTEAKILDQRDEIASLKSKVQKLNEQMRKQNGTITIKELEKAKLEKEIENLQKTIDNCWYFTNPALQTPLNENRPSKNRAELDQRPKTSMGFIRSRTPKQEGGERLQQRQVNVMSVPAKNLESKFNQSSTPGNEAASPTPTPTPGPRASSVTGKALESQRDRVRREIKDRQFQGGAASPIFDIQVRANQALNKKLRTELVTLRARVQEMVTLVDTENSKSATSLMETKERVQCRIEKLEVGLHMKHEINERVAKEVQKRVEQMEEDVKVLMKQQKDELLRLKTRLHSETREKRKQLTSARSESEKKEHNIIQSQDDRIKRLQYQMQSKEHNMMQKQHLMEQENRAVLLELDEKCQQKEKLDKKNHELKQKIVKLEEEIKQEHHKYNLQKIELDDIKAKAKRDSSTSHGLKDQYESLKNDLKDARVTAEDYINKFNLATYQIEQLVSLLLPITIPHRFTRFSPHPNK